MRAAFCGASGTGKSTLAEWVAERTGAPMCPIGSRSVAVEMGLVDEQGRPDPYRADAAGRRREFQTRLIASKAEWERGRESFVTDRTTLDNVAYAILHDVGGLTADLLRASTEGVRRYTRVFFCPTSAFQQIGEDVARVGGGADARTIEDASAYHDCFDALLFALLLRHRYDVVVLGNPDLEARKTIVAGALGIP